jgi:hypothetical protein
MFYEELNNRDVNLMKSVSSVFWYHYCRSSPVIETLKQLVGCAESDGI